MRDSQRDQADECHKSLRAARLHVRAAPETNGLRDDVAGLQPLYDCLQELRANVAPWVSRNVADGGHEE